MGISSNIVGINDSKAEQLSMAAAKASSDTYRPAMIDVKAADEVVDWMSRVKALQKERQAEDEARTRQLEADIAAERKARQARRAARSKSLSPAKTSAHGLQIDQLYEELPYTIHPLHIAVHAHKKIPSTVNEEDGEGDEAAICLLSSDAPKSVLVKAGVSTEDKKNADLLRRSGRVACLRKTSSEANLGNKAGTLEKTISSNNRLLLHPQLFTTPIVLSTQSAPTLLNDGAVMASELPLKLSELSRNHKYRAGSSETTTTSMEHTTAKQLVHTPPSMKTGVRVCEEIEAPIKSPARGDFVVSAVKQDIISNSPELSHQKTSMVDKILAVEGLKLAHMNSVSAAGQPTRALLPRSGSLHKSNWLDNAVSGKIRSRHNSIEHVPELQTGSVALRPQESTNLLAGRDPLKTEASGSELLLSLRQSLRSTTGNRSLLADGIRNSLHTAKSGSRSQTLVGDGLSSASRNALENGSLASCTKPSLFLPEITAKHKLHASCPTTLSPAAAHSNIVIKKRELLPPLTPPKPRALTNLADRKTTPDVDTDPHIFVSPNLTNNLQQESSPQQQSERLLHVLI